MVEVVFTFTIIPWFIFFFFFFFFTQDLVKVGLHVVWYIPCYVYMCIDSIVELNCYGIRSTGMAYA